MALAQSERQPVPDRTSFTAMDSVEYIWKHLGLPLESLDALDLKGSGPGLPSSFKIADLAQASIGLSALLAAQIYALRTASPVPAVSVSRQHAVIEFKSERLGLHKTSDGHVRVHDGFPNHSNGAKTLLRCPPSSDRPTVSAAIAPWRSVDLETAAFDASCVISALRSYAQWDVTPQARASMRSAPPDKCLRGLRVLELSRVIATPLSGKTLAAHGADVLWIDLDSAEGEAELWRLLDDAHVFVQGYRPGSLAARGFSPETLGARAAARGRGIICANLSAYGPDGPWRGRRGFDSLVQTCSGMNVSEAEHYGAGEPGRAAPCQVLDHAAGYFLAAGIEAAVYRQAVEGVRARDYTCLADVPEQYLQTRQTGFGEMTFVRHSAAVEGVEVGWDVMPKPLGSDEKRWL
ncbi:CAIB/BAIF family enzyme [Aspergillus novofumigatus IBT 16806]|uniref:CoA-transferase family III n=1 Tax=Aspergillus novofumigatus (strain IBT 16806) TaxID=1392255 RepID=A0A2I1C2T7_ASPN1|nr:CoA-transferase family III [Aspergillus novofumigatus IBT 16806]PKX91956.1 CoA-transferase family III [Aspergillus novofumigatus IBT 16806]